MMNEHIFVYIFWNLLFFMRALFHLKWRCLSQSIPIHNPLGWFNDPSDLMMSFFPRLRIFDWNMLNRCTVNEAQAHRWIEQSLRIFIHDEVILAELLLGAAPLAAFTMSDHHPKRIWTLKNLSQVTMLFSQKWPYLKEKWGGVPSTLTVTHCAKLTKIVLFAKWDGCTVANQLLSQSQVQIN